MISRGVPLARRNLQRQRGRLVLSVGGVGLALLLILSLDALYAGMLRQITAYVDGTGAGAIVSQRGVKTMHMSSSSLPLSTLERVRRAPGVSRAEPILYSTVVLSGRKPATAYLIGYRSGGGPRSYASGARRPGPGGMLLDRSVAERIGVGVGDRLRVAGRSLRVTGLTGGTSSVVGSVAFVEYDTFLRATRARGIASYLLVWPKRGVSDAELSRSLAGRLPDASVQTRSQFVAQERRVVSDMSTDLIRGLTLVGFVVGVAVAGLMIYTTTVQRVREYAVLRAIGLRSRSLYALVVRQALLVVGLGLVAALLLLGGLAILIPQLAPQVSLVLTSGDLLQAAVATLLIGLLASLFPARRVARVEPASVYRGGSL